MPNSQDNLDEAGLTKSEQKAQTAYISKITLRSLFGLFIGYWFVKFLGYGLLITHPAMAPGTHDSVDVIVASGAYFLSVAAGLHLARGQVRVGLSALIAAIWIVALIHISASELVQHMYRVISAAPKTVLIGGGFYLIVGLISEVLILPFCYVMHTRALRRELEYEERRQGYLSRAEDVE